MRRCFLLVTAADMANQIIHTKAMVATSSTHAKECFSAYRQNTFAKSNTVRAMNKTADIYSSILSRKVFRSNFPSFIQSTPAYFFAW